MSKWVTPERQALLVKLFTLYGNKCLLGHTACMNPEHYVQDIKRLCHVPQAKAIPCIDKNGSPLKDSEGNQLYLTVYTLLKDYIHERITKRVDITGNGDMMLNTLYDVKSEALKRDWIIEDRVQANEDYKAEYAERHRLAKDRLPLRGHFSGIAKDIYYDSQPQFYIESTGISGLTFKPIACVRISSDYVRLYVDISQALTGISKHKRRKAIRYFHTSLDLQTRLYECVRLAVKDYLKF